MNASNESSSSIPATYRVAVVGVGIMGNAIARRLLERGHDVFAWISEGAHVYVCGDAQNLAPDVHEALKSVLDIHGGMKDEWAEEYLRGMQRDRRYQRDVY